MVMYVRNKPGRRILNGSRPVLAPFVQLMASREGERLLAVFNGLARKHLKICKYNVYFVRHDRCVRSLDPAKSNFSLSLKSGNLKKIVTI